MIGIFGGSFNPPHLGHLLAAVYALERWSLEQVWWVPTFDHAFNKSLAPFATRVQLCQTLINKYPQFRLLTLEQDIDAQGRMWLVLQQLKRQYPEQTFAVIIGSDIVADLDRWYNASELRRHFQLLVVPRATATASLEATLPAISSSDIRQRLARQQPVDDLTGLPVAGLLEKGLGQFFISPGMVNPSDPPTT